MGRLQVQARGTESIAEASTAQARGTQAVAEASLAQANASRSIADQAAVQAAAAGDLARTAQQQLTLSERPWLRIDVALADPPPSFTSSGFRIGINLSSENVGKSVATDVTFAADLVAISDTDQIAPASAIVCHRAEQQSIGGLPDSVFPGKPRNMGNLGLFLNNELIKSQLSVPTSRTYLLLNGEIEYNFPRAGQTEVQAASEEKARGLRPYPVFAVIGCLDYTIGIPVYTIKLRSSIT